MVARKGNLEDGSKSESSDTSTDNSDLLPLHLLAGVAGGTLQVIKGDHDHVDLQVDLHDNDQVDLEVVTGGL